MSPTDPSQLIFVYGPDGVPYPDQTCEQQLVSKLWEIFQNPLGLELVFRVSTENIISAVRCLKKEGNIPFDVIIRIENGPEPKDWVDHYVRDDGRLDSWPSVLNMADKFLERLI